MGTVGVPVVVGLKGVCAVGSAPTVEVVVAGVEVVTVVAVEAGTTVVVTLLAVTMASSTESSGKAAQ
jgi:hypothetical protein